jgi:hypothetical protein
MKLSLLTVLLAAALSLVGCASITVPEPVGANPRALTASQWEGVWSTGHDVVTVKLMDDAIGHLQCLTTETRDGTIQLKTTDVFIRESGGWIFANTRFDDATPASYLWARILLFNGDLVIWEPDLEKFRGLVRAGRLRGTLDGDDVHLASFTAAELQALTAGTLGVPFAWDKPLVLHRVAQ